MVSCSPRLISLMELCDDRACVSQYAVSAAEGYSYDDDDDDGNLRLATTSSIASTTCLFGRAPGSSRPSVSSSPSSFSSSSAVTATADPCRLMMAMSDRRSVLSFSQASVVPAVSRFLDPPGSSSGCRSSKPIEVGSVSPSSTWSPSMREDMPSEYRLSSLTTLVRSSGGTNGVQGPWLIGDTLGCIIRGTVSPLYTLGESHGWKVPTRARGLSMSLPLPASTLSSAKSSTRSCTMLRSSKVWCTPGSSRRSRVLESVGTGLSAAAPPLLRYSSSASSKPREVGLGRLSCGKVAFSIILKVSKLGRFGSNLIVYELCEVNGFANEIC
ncbi:hypothetical protein F4778DRAFT_751679 [Xylariomycetidae sp. FL2044]|nr:hypothetical protein F4778DRAFT_751679 [Xylariomycetidae sp. FL2044]